MASLLSQNQLDCPIFACTKSQNARQWMNLQWGLISFCLEFGDNMESNLHQIFVLLKARGMMKSGNLVIAVSDNSSASQTVNFQWQKWSKINYPKSKSPSTWVLKLQNHLQEIPLIKGFPFQQYQELLQLGKTRKNVYIFLTKYFTLLVKKSWLTTVLWT